MDKNIKTAVKNILIKGDDGIVRMPLFDTVNEVYGDVFLYLNKFMPFALLVSLFVTITDFILKTQHICTYSVQSSENIFTCNESAVVGLGSFFIRTIFMIYFMVGWHKIRYMNAKISDVLGFDKVFIKYLAFAFVYVFLMSTPAISAQILTIRNPSYGVLIELAIFGLIGIGVMGPFVSGRILIILADIAFDKGGLSLKKLWQSGKGNNLKIVSLQLATLFFIFLKPAYMPVDKVQIMLIKYPVITTIIEDFVYNLIVLIQLGLLVNLSVAVHYYLYRPSVEESE